MAQAASLAVQAYEDLRRRIGNGRIRAGSRLSTATLSAAFGMSHTLIREALARLHADGLAEFSANRGYRAAAAPDAAAYGHWMQARIAIEVSALRLAVAPLNPALIRPMETANRAIEQARPGLSPYAEARRFAEAISTSMRPWSKRPATLPAARLATGGADRPVLPHPLARRQRAEPLGHRAGA